MGVVKPDRPEPRSSGAVYCEYCSRRDHIFARGWKRASDRRHNGAAHREYRGHDSTAGSGNDSTESNVG